MKKASILSINISKEKGTAKQPVPEATIGKTGIEGDAHAGNWHRQVSILSRETMDAFEKDIGRRIQPGEFAENLTIEGLPISHVQILDRLTINDVELEITQIGKECHGDACSIFREVGRCVMPKQGLFARVIRGGRIKQGRPILYHPKTLKVDIMVLSDRASRGDYEDRSGPAIENILDQFFANKRRRPAIDRALLPDDPKQLNEALQSSVDNGADIIITSGGTGVGPRDITPEVITDFCDKIIPGIMEHIRTTYGADKPNALLSRSIAGVKGRTLIYAIPGSVRAVQEYMQEILKTTEHALFMLHGLDVH